MFHPWHQGPPAPLGAVSQEYPPSSTKCILKPTGNKNSSGSEVFKCQLREGGCWTESSTAVSLLPRPVLYALTLVKDRGPRKPRNWNLDQALTPCPWTWPFTPGVQKAHGMGHGHRIHQPQEG